MRLNPIIRKSEILNAALALASDGNYKEVSRGDIAVKANCSAGLVSFYFGDMKGVRAAVMAAAIRTQNLIVLAQGLAANDPKARGAPAALRQKAARLLANRR